MKSQFGDKFNHDGWETLYDNDVADETHPIRAGYQRCLDWIAKKAQITRSDSVVDLGIGTGNLSQRLPGCHHVIGVDISQKMMAVAATKVTVHDHLSLIHSDLLAYFDDAPKIDAVVSSYAIHHLTEDEKQQLFRRIDAVLKPGGRAVFGDLAFADADARTQAIAYYEENGRSDIVFDIQDEFFWLVDRCVATMKSLGWLVETTRFSDLSWGIAGHKR